MNHRTQALLIAALALVPFTLGNKGCDDTSTQHGTELNDGEIGSGAADGDGRGKSDTFSLEACDTCPQPGPKAPTVQCDDGSVAGPACIRDASGACSWTILACPASDTKPPEGTTCGGIVGIGCPDGEYCRFDASCGAADQTGVCTKKPEVCTAIYSPVCGCDGKTYSSDCAAAGAGVSVASKGECGAASSSCGGFAGKACPEGEYCQYAADASCGFADQTGTCTPKPDACTKEYVPVCGCDGKTYGNACSAAAAGISVAKQGECGPTACNSCAGPAPAAPNYECPDGVSIGGPACVIDEATGKCGWTILDCPPDAPTTDCHSGKPPAKGCWTDEHCASGKCVGASCCPIGANCFAPDMPGTCQ